MTVDESAADLYPESRSASALADLTPARAGSAPEGERPPSSSSSTDDGPLPDDLVTRLLSARAYLHDSFADLVAGQLLSPGRRALSPLWGVDAVRLARHAAQAGTLRRDRDRGLAVTLAYVLAAGSCVLVTAVAGWLRPGPAVAIWLMLWIWGYVVAVRLCLRRSLTARRAAVSVIYEPDEVRPAPLERSAAEAALHDLNHSNVVLFRGDASPFVGSGVRVDNWAMTIDLAKRPAAHPDPITGGDLQEFLLATLPGRVNPRPCAGHRLYVRGGSNALSVPLFRSGPVPRSWAGTLDFRRPVPRVPDAVVQHYLHDQDEGARVYTWFNHSAWGGQVVVSLFVRAFVSNQTLFVEGLVYALRPLAQQFYEVRGLPTDRRLEASTLLREAVAGAPRLLSQAPGQVLAAWRADRAAASAAATMEHEIEGRRDIDFGAWTSLREQVANDALTDQFAAADERMYYQIFNRRAIEGIGAFLEQRHVDLSEFSAQAGAIVGATTANARATYGEAGPG